MDTRIIYDKKYYKLLAALSSQKIQVLLSSYHTRLRELGAPVNTSTGFFKTARDYHAWANSALSKGVFYPGLIEDIINHFFKKSDDHIKLGFWWYIYFGVKKPPIKTTSTKNIEVADDRSHLKVTLNIYPWTVKEDILTGLWEIIKAKQQKLVDHKRGKRNREWNTFERDLKIYELFLRIKKESPKSVYRRLVEHPEFEKIAKTSNSGESIDESIGSIITKCRRHFTDIDLI